MISSVWSYKCCKRGPQVFNHEEQGTIILDHIWSSEVGGCVTQSRYSRDFHKDFTVTTRRPVWPKTWIIAVKGTRSSAETLRLRRPPITLFGKQGFDPPPPGNHEHTSASLPGQATFVWLLYGTSHKGKKTLRQKQVARRKSCIGLRAGSMRTLFFVTSSSGWLVQTRVIVQISKETWRWCFSDCHAVFVRCKQTNVSRLCYHNRKCCKWTVGYCLRERMFNGSWWLRLERNALFWARNKLLLWRFWDIFAHFEIKALS